jgi:hypothetical protein
MENKKLRQLIMKCFEPLEDTNIINCAGAQIIDGKWYMPVWGCDTVQHILDNLTKEE